MITIDNNLNKEDKEEIKRIFESSGFFYNFEVDIALSIFDETIEKGQEKSQYYWLLLRSDKQLLGCAIFGPNPCTLYSWDFYWMVIDQNHRNAHLGKTLLAKVEQISKEKGCRILWIETAGREIYLPTRQFYLRNNYVEAACMTDFYAPGDDKVIYRKDLAVCSAFFLQ